MRIIPRDEQFFDLFDELAAKITEGAQLFLDLVETSEDFHSKVTKLKEIEHEADMITHRTYEKMHKTLLTPLDREDIYALVNKMDSILDMTEATAVRMSIYKVKHTYPELIDQSKTTHCRHNKGQGYRLRLTGYEKCPSHPPGLYRDQHHGKYGRHDPPYLHGESLRTGRGSLRTDQMEGDLRTVRRDTGCL